MQPGEHEEIQAIRAELEGLRAQVESSGSGGGGSWSARATARPRLAKRLTSVGLVALMLALPVIVSASHQFTDVPTSHTFHTAISRLYGARLTTGCSSTRFCPGANVTRGQMAAFLNRGLGRAAGDVGFSGRRLGEPERRSLTDVDLQHGGAPGGTAPRPGHRPPSRLHGRNGRLPVRARDRHLQRGHRRGVAGHVEIISGVERSPVDGTSDRYYETTVTVSHLFTVPAGVTNTYAWRRS